MCPLEKRRQRRRLRHLVLVLGNLAYSGTYSHSLVTNDINVSVRRLDAPS